MLAGGTEGRTGGEQHQPEGFDSQSQTEPTQKALTPQTLQHCPLADGESETETEGAAPAY